MLYRTTLLTFIVAFGVASAFAVPADDNIARPTTDAGMVCAHTEDGSSLEKTESKSTTTPKKMKSNTFRWFVRGVIGELYHNIFLRHIKRFRIKTLNNDNQMICRRRPRKEIAIVTGATGGIGSHMAHSLAIYGYDVVIAARDKARGAQLVNEIEERLAEMPICEPRTSDDAKDLPTVSFVEYHADKPQSALDFASSVKQLNREVTVLINNAGIMGKSKQLTMRVNLIGPVLLTFALLPLMNKSKGNATIINVGSSAHLRAAQVIDEHITRKKNELYISALPNTEDCDLSTYSQSKLALMQFSSLLRKSLRNNSSIAIYDAHPGLVWTPLLRNHIGNKATNTLRKTGLANLIYKTPLEGANAIVAAIDYSSKVTEHQIYFENGKPGGYATPESRDYTAALMLWNDVIAPEVRKVMSIPDVLSLNLD